MKFVQFLRTKTGAAVSVLSSAFIAGQAFADGGSIDVSPVTAIIVGGVAAVGTIGAAWVGFKYLQKVWQRV